MNNPPNPEDFVAEEYFLLLYVGRTVGDDLAAVYPADVYAAAQGWWHINPTDLEPGLLVLARNSDRVLGVFRTRSWRRDPDQNSTRWGFVGEPAEIDAQLRYMGRRVPDQYRGQNPVRYGPDPA